MIRAKEGIKIIIKETRMAFYLGKKNEEEKNTKIYFLSTKLLQNIYDTELTLDLIVVLFSNILILNIVPTIMKNIKK